MYFNIYSTCQCGCLVLLLYLDSLKCTVGESRVTYINCSKQRSFSITELSIRFKFNFPVLNGHMWLVLLYYTAWLVRGGNGLWTAGRLWGGLGGRIGSKPDAWAPGEAPVNPRWFTPRQKGVLTSWGLFSCHKVRELWVVSGLEIHRTLCFQPFRPFIYLFWT